MGKRKYKAETKMRLLKILVSLVATSHQSEAFNERRWGEGRRQGPMQRQGVASSSNGGPLLEACTPYDAEPSIFSNQWVTYLQSKWQDCIFRVGTLKILIHQN